MDRPAFKAASERVWLPALVVLVVILAGSFVYVKERIPPTAQASVAVRDPLTVNTSTNSAAAVPFDSIIDSDRLASMVSHQLGPRAGDAKGALSVSTILPASGINISPLYVIKAHAKSVALAEAIVNAAISQGRNLYAQLNDGSSGAGAAVQPELQAANASLASATKAYDNFVASSGGDRSAPISALSGEISALTTDVAQAQASTQSGAGGSAVATKAEIAGLQTQLDEAEQQLASLEPQQSQYEQLYTTLTNAQTNVQQLTQLEQQAAAGQALPIADEVKVLDKAAPSSNGLLKFLVYALGVILGLLAAFSIIYLEAARQRSRVTPKELVAVLGIPTLGRIPPHALAREAT